MSARLLSFRVARDGFRPYPAAGGTWWSADSCKEAGASMVGMWPDSGFWPESEWRQLYASGYRYGALLKDGHCLAMAGLWAWSDEAWEVIAVGVSPDHRCRGLGKGIVSFVTEEILSHGRVATITTREDNAAMLRVIECLGFQPRTNPSGS
jgi:GNAT superfamily N-acetyltransferase